MEDASWRPPAGFTPGVSVAPGDMPLKKLLEPLALALGTATYMQFGVICGERGCSTVSHLRNLTKPALKEAFHETGIDATQFKTFKSTLQRCLAPDGSFEFKDPNIASGPAAKPRGGDRGGWRERQPVPGVGFKASIHFRLPVCLLQQLPAKGSADRLTMGEMQRVSDLVWEFARYHPDQSVGDYLNGAPLRLMSKQLNQELPPLPLVANIRERKWENVLANRFARARQYEVTGAQYKRLKVCKSEADEDENLHSTVIVVDDDDDDGAESNFIGKKAMTAAVRAAPS